MSTSCHLAEKMYSDHKWSSEKKHGSPAHLGVLILDGNVADLDFNLHAG